MDQITAKVKKIAYRKAENGWSILLCDVGACKGVVEWEPKDGDELDLEGEWKVSKFNGKKEFVFKTALLHVPTDARGLLHYACSITPGMGPVRESQIWEYYGEVWRESDITAIPGITEKIEWHWKDTLARLDEQSVKTQAIAFLLSHGCTLNMAACAWEMWMGETIGVVTSNPYELAKLPRYGFISVDRGVRETFGIGDTDERRIRACLLYYMERLTERGSTLVLFKDLYKWVHEAIPQVEKVFSELVNDLVESDDIVRVDVDALALKNDWENAKAIWERFAA